MSDTLDAFLEDILSLPRWVNRSLCLLRDLDLKSQQCGEEAQRRRSRYLALAKRKLSAANTTTIPSDFYEDPELVAEAEAARERGREAHALMKEKLVVLNQLIRILRGETETFRVSLARFAREVGGEDALRHLRRKPENNAVTYLERADKGAPGSPLLRVLGGPPQPAARGPAAARSRVGVVSSSATSAASAVASGAAAAVGGGRAEHSVGLGATSEAGGSGALSALPPCLPPSLCVSSRSRPPTKKAALKNSGSVTAASSADTARPVKRLKAPTAMGAPMKAHQEAGGKGGNLFGEIDQGFVIHLGSGAMKGLGEGQVLPAEVGPPLCSGGSGLGAHPGLSGSRVKRAKPPIDALQDVHTVNSQSSHALLSEQQEDKLNGAGRAERAPIGGRPKKNKEASSGFSFAGAGEARKTFVDTPRHCIPSAWSSEYLESTADQPPAGLVIRLPPPAAVGAQQAATAKIKFAIRGKQAANNNVVDRSSLA